MTNAEDRTCAGLSAQAPFCSCGGDRTSPSGSARVTESALSWKMHRVPGDKCRPLSLTMSPNPVDGATGSACSSTGAERDTLHCRPTVLWPHPHG